MNDLKSAFRQLLKNPGFTVHPPQCRRPDRVQFPRCCSRKPGHLRQYSYGGRAVAVLTLALAIGANTASGAGVQNWPRFRGPNGSGVSESRDLPVEFGPMKNLAWRTAVPAGHSSPVVWGNRVFLTG